ncbi:MAG: glucose-6-phosphate isomerase family protein [Candidatus Micrarchaeota archaeon]
MKLDTLGLRLEFDEKRFALYCENKEIKPNLRTLGDLKPVLADKAFGRKITPAMAKRVQYYMFRGIAAKPADKKIFAKARVSFDVTVLPKLDLGKEFNKTLGHYHERAASGKAYPEIYEVLSGEAIYLFQKKRADGVVEDVVYCKAKKGDQVLIPPGYGHTTTNAGRGTLVMSNLIALQESDYGDFVKHKGAAVYVFHGKNGEIELKKNKAYPRLPKPREWRAKRVWPNGLYASFAANQASFDFLTKPERILLG